MADQQVWRLKATCPSVMLLVSLPRCENSEVLARGMCWEAWVLEGLCALVGHGEGHGLGRCNHCTFPVIGDEVVHLVPQVLFFAFLNF